MEVILHKAERDEITRMCNVISMRLMKEYFNIYFPLLIAKHRIDFDEDSVVPKTFFSNLFLMFSKFFDVDSIYKFLYKDKSHNLREPVSCYYYCCYCFIVHMIAKKNNMETNELMCQLEEFIDNKGGLRKTTYFLALMEFFNLK